MARLTRHELKKDEFADRLTTVTHVFTQNRRRIILGGGTLLLLVGVSLAVLLYLRSQQTKASDALSTALATYHAMVTPSPPQGTNLPHFKTREEKYKEALRQFTEVSVQFRRRSQGRMARYYAALSQRELGNSAEAEKELTAIARESDPDVAALAKMALAALYQQTSRTAEAEKTYRELESNPTALVPKPAVQIALAELYQKTNPSQATALYQQIEKENPGTTAGDQAARMLRGSAP